MASCTRQARDGTCDENEAPRDEWNRGHSETYIRAECVHHLTDTSDYKKKKLIVAIYKSAESYMGYYFMQIILVVLIALTH